MGAADQPNGESLGGVDPTIRGQLAEHEGHLGDKRGAGGGIVRLYRCPRRA